MLWSLVVSILSINKSCIYKQKNKNFYLTQYSCTEFDTILNKTELFNDESYDWRDYGIVTDIKNQGNCGSCWTFSATGAMESAWNINKFTKISLSEQQLIDCVKNDNGCNGGEMTDAFEYAIQNPMCTEKEDPYEAEDEKCINCNSNVKFSACYKLVENNELLMKHVVKNYGPISVAIQADQSVFRNYEDGIIDSDSCGTNLDHGVLIVGYGVENDKKYWIVKNSWGTDWGENGYVRILRTDNTNYEGICGIAMQPSFPVV